MKKKHIFVFITVISAVLVTAIVLGVVLGRDGSSASGASASIKNAADPYCILLTGSDVAAGLCDVMMLVSFDPLNERVFVLQIPRDTYAEYTENSYKKLNGAKNALGSSKELCAFLSDALGIAIDGYVSIDLEAFCTVVDSVGGVEIELDEPMKYSDPYQDLYIDLPRGSHTLNGKQAQMFVRYRSGYATGDLGRIDAQKKFLAAFFAALKERITVENVYEVVSSVADKIDTNVDIPMMIALGLEALKVNERDLLFCTLPGEAVTGKKSGASYYVMTLGSTEKILCEYFCKTREKTDPDRLFEHPDNEDFIKIYRSEREGRVINAAQLK